MKHKNRHIFRLLLTLPVMMGVTFSTSHAQVKGGEGAFTTSEMGYVVGADKANYDSLLNSYYLKKYASAVNKHYNQDFNSSLEEFDRIPDSVFAKRLSSLPTVVPMTYNSIVRSYIKLYIRVFSKRLDVMLTLSEYYFPIFESTLNRYGVPQELEYLVIIESAFNPQATSRVGAAGLWQFMYRTGKNYGLEVNSLYDDRRDPIMSTQAAARYLRDLHKIYNDWTLAIAAYNCGPGNINKAITRAGGKRDFWEIYPYLPKETRGYVPAYIGAAYAMNFYHEHGLRPRKIDIPIHSDTIHLKGDALYYYVHQYTGVDINELRTLNPQYRTDLVPVSSGRSALCLPVSKIPLVIRYEDSIVKATHDSLQRKPIENLSSETSSPSVAQANERIVHKVKKGETLGKIASRYHVSVSDIKRWNKKRSNTVQVGERLVIYRKNPNYVAPKKTAETPTDTLSRTPEPVNDSIKTGDTEVDKPSVAQQPKPTPKPAPKKPAPVKYKVKAGDNLTKIASRNGTTVEKIKKLNNLRSDVIREGQILIVK